MLYYAAIVGKKGAAICCIANFRKNQVYGRFDPKTFPVIACLKNSSARRGKSSASTVKRSFLRFSEIPLKAYCPETAGAAW